MATATRRRRAPKAVRSKAEARRKGRRVTLYKTRDGFRYKVQGHNWKIIDASEEGKRNRQYVLDEIEARWPGVELVDNT